MEVKKRRTVEVMAEVLESLLLVQAPAKLVVVPQLNVGLVPLAEEVGHEP